MSEAGVENGLRPIRKFNPGLLQSDDEVIEQFVVREHELGLVRDVLRSNVDAPSCQHVLVTAPRGLGKTMLLARVAAEIRRDTCLAAHLVPVRFMEESQEIYSLADFWMETLHHLAGQIAAREPGLAKELSATHAALSSRWREENLEGMAQAAVLDAADRLDRRLVLMVENVQSLFGAVDGEFGWGLRAVLQSVPQIMLVASATSRFASLDDPQAPFFELFRLVHLEPLTTEECGRLWSVVSGETPRGHEIRPLEILTGGSPRLIVVVATFARHRSLRQLMEELVSLVDEHTEYFRSHLEALPRNERRVFVSLVDLWQASSTGEIAARARLDVRVVSTMLGRLIERGAVMVVAEGDGGRRLYAASERLYSIYYKLRRERDEATVVEALIHFMVAFYDIGEMLEISEHLLRDALDSTAVHAGIDRALAGRSSLDDLPVRMKWDEIETTSNQVRSRRRADALIRLQDDAQAAYEEEDWRRVLEIAERYEADGWPGSAPGREREHDWAHLAHLRSDAYLRLKEYDQVVAIEDEVAERLGGTRDVTLLHRTWSVGLNKAAAYYELSDFARAKSESGRIAERFGQYRSPWHDAQVAAALLIEAKAESELGDAGRAIALLDEVLERFGDSDETDVQRSVARSLVEKAEIASMHHDDHAGAARIYDDAIERFGGSEHPEIRKSVNSARLNRTFVHGSIGNFEQELAGYDDFIGAVTGGNKLAGWEWPALMALMFKGRRLAELGRGEEALATCDDVAQGLEASADKCPPETRMWMNWYARGTRALGLMALGATAAAVEAFRGACAVFPPHSETAMGEMLRLVPELVAAGASEQELISVLIGEEQNAQALQPLIVALRMRTGESVRAPAEVLEVAADLDKRIEERLANGVTPGFSYRRCHPCPAGVD